VQKDVDLLRQVISTCDSVEFISKVLRRSVDDIRRKCDELKIALGGKKRRGPHANSWVGLQFDALLSCRD
jgi:hypothetical protein